MYKPGNSSAAVIPGFKSDYHMGVGPIETYYFSLNSKQGIIVVVYLVCIMGCCFQPVDNKKHKDHQGSGHSASL